jgi:hypothetical protein
MRGISRLAVVVACGISWAASISAQNTQTPQEQLLDSTVTTMKGTIRGGRTVMINGTAVEFPDGCAFRYILPPDKAALQWNQLTPATIDKANNTCQAVFEVGVPSSVPKTTNGIMNGSVAEFVGSTPGRRLLRGPASPS